MASILKKAATESLAMDLLYDAGIRNVRIVPFVVVFNDTFRVVFFIID
jgi:hypothetical protein